VRLQSAVDGIIGDGYAKLQFSVDDSRFLIVTGHVGVDVSVICQRCLEPVTITIGSPLNLALVRKEDDAKHLPKQFDPWLITVEQEEADLYEVLEEELLLSLPIVSYHNTECAAPLCAAPLKENTEAIEPQQKNPFEVLEQLKKKMTSE
jgi:uncharacterized protein